MDDGLDSSAEEEEQQILHRLRSGLAAALGLLSLLACAAIAAELIAHVATVVEAQRALAQGARAGGIAGGPFFTANVQLDVRLILEAVVLEPLFIFAAVGVFAFTRRISYALSLAGMIAYNVAAIGFLAFAWGWGVGSSREHALAAVLTCLIGLPIAEFGLWTLFRPGERGRYAR